MCVISINSLKCAHKDHGEGLEKSECHSLFSGGSFSGNVLLFNKSYMSCQCTI